MSFDDAVRQMRVHTVRAVVHGLNDTGAEQMLTVESHAGHVRQQVPVHYPFGFASRVPLDGAVTLLHAAGGDQADLVALPPSNPSQSRFGALPEGDSVVYDAAGQRLHFHNGVLAEVQASSELRVVVGGATVLQVTKTGVAITGDLTVSGKVVAQGDVTAGTVSLQQHVHTGVQSGPSTTGKPQA